MQLSNNFYEMHCYVYNFISNNQFLANFEMSQSLPFLTNMPLSVACGTFGKLESRTLIPNRFKSQSIDIETTWPQLQPSTRVCSTKSCHSPLLLYFLFDIKRQGAIKPLEFNEVDNNCGFKLKFPRHFY